MGTPDLPPDPLCVPTTYPSVQRRALTVDITDMRVHELALQNLLYRTFIVADGYPVPVVFATPMDAFSEFDRLWKDEKNSPYRYLFDLKDENGVRLYEPYPSNTRYPLISVKRKGMSPRPTQSYGIHRYRRMYYPTVSEDVELEDLGNVVQSRMPSAWNFRYQIDHWCKRPDTQAYFWQQVTRRFVQGGSAQSWMPIVYPGWNGETAPYVRLYLDGDITDSSSEESDDSPVEFRTTINVVVEGYSFDYTRVVIPTLWTLITGTGVVSPDQLGQIYVPDVVTVEDLRKDGSNPVFNGKNNLPPKT